MFNNQDDFPYKYAPILAIRPAEMTALEELTDKDKDSILPIIPLKGWSSSKKLENSILRIDKAFGERPWIADIDISFIEDNIDKKITGEYPREVFTQIEDLLNPADGYNNWYEYLKGYLHIIPTVQLGDLRQLELQIKKLNSLGRGLVIRFKLEKISFEYCVHVLGTVQKSKLNNVFVIFDYGQINHEILTLAARVSSMVKNAHSLIPSNLFAISCSSFPSFFHERGSGENSIYERQLYDLVSKSCDGVRMIYSDRASARANKIGGGRAPSPRIDYPLKHEWHFIRKGLEDGEREELYAKVAQSIMKQDYWEPNLRVWGTQIIELTSRGDEFGINSPMFATAVRINLHIHRQLHYDLPLGNVPDTDDDWLD